MMVQLVKDLQPMVLGRNFSQGLSCYSSSAPTFQRSPYSLLKEQPFATVAILLIL